MKPARKSYASAGVDIDLGNQLKGALPALLRQTHRRGVIRLPGGFGGLFELDGKAFRQPVLVSSVDGVGTKLKVAFAMGRHDTIGEDLVNHCVNDIAVLGAAPLFFLDYIGTEKLRPEVFRQIIQGFVRGCKENRCALIGGETAQMPGFYRRGEYDLCGTIVGLVEKKRLLTGKSIRRGDAVIGLGSNGLHTNGYTLARRIVVQRLKLKWKAPVADLGHSIGEEFLRVHKTYGPLLQTLVPQFNRGGSRQPIKGFAHITGGGFLDNIPRILPKGLDALIERGSWEVPPVFALLQKGGKIPEQEMYQVFNMGIGMVAIVAPDQADALLRRIRSRRQPAWRIGKIIRGQGQVALA